MRRASFGAVAALAWCLAAGGVQAQEEDAARAKLDAEIKLTAGIAYQNNGMDQEALDRFEEALALDPESGTGHFLAATALLGMKRYADALPHLDRARELQPRLPAGRLDWFTGEAQYWTGDYAAAESSFRSAVNADPRDAYGHFYLGLTQLQLGKDRDGIASLDRAVALDSKLAATGAYYAGKKLYEQGDAVRAKAEFEKALSGATEQNLQEASSNYLAALQPAEAPAPKKFHLRAGYFIDADSNVVLAPADPSLSTISDESDGRSVIQLRVAGYPVLSSGNNTVGLFLNYYQSIHFDLSAFDLTAPQAVVSYVWGKDPEGYLVGPITLTQTPVGRTPVVFSIQYGFNYYLLDGDSFLRTNELGASLEIPEGNKTATQIDLDYRDNTYFQYQARTGTFAQARLIQHVQLGRPAYLMDIGLRYAQNDANAIDGDFATQPIELQNHVLQDGGISNDYDGDESEIFTNLSFALPRRVALAFQLAYIDRQFDNINSRATLGLPDTDNTLAPDPTELRKDKLLVASTSVVVGFGQHWSLQGGLAYYDQSSTKTFFEYDRTVVSLGFNWLY